MGHRMEIYVRPEFAEKVIEISKKEDVEAKTAKKKLSKKERQELIESLTAQMKEAAKMLEFEHAAFLRDEIRKLKEA